MAFLYSGNVKEFNVLSSGNSHPGILYHIIGLNGVRYDQYNISLTFWQQLQELNADPIHFTAAGYRIQGNLLFNAPAKGYNNYVSSYQEGSGL